jgi:predicted cobalt transporter CbtA
MVRNERLKLLANFVSALGLGLIAIAVLRPLFETGGNLRQIVLWALAGLALHGMAHYILGHMK